MKKILFAFLILFALVSGAAAQDNTPEPTGEATIEATSEATAQATAEATAEATLPPGAFASFPGPGSYTVRQPYGDIQRSYRVYIPASYSDDGEAFPLVIILHGAGGDGASTEAFTGFDDLAEKNNFIVVYPNGVNNVWNDGRQGDVRVGNIDDVRFLSNIVEFMEHGLKIDAKRVYAGGYSMGGMMAYRLGCEKPIVFAAVASVASGMPVYVMPSCTNTLPIPVIVFQGTDDPIVPWTGIPNAYLSAAQTLGFWSDHNHCSGYFAVENLPDSAPTDHTLVMRQQLNGCAADMVLYGVYFGGHTWPGHPINVPALGQTTQDIDASAVMWDFFSAHAKA